MTDLPGQTTLYVESPDAFRQRIALARAHWTAARLARAEYLKNARILRRAEDKALAEFLEATADEAAQQSIGSALTPDDTAADEAETAQTLKEARRRRVRDQAVRTLHGCGGHLSNRELAGLMGQDSHGLASLLEGDERLEKFHGGREKNEQTHWKLTPLGTDWANGKVAA